MFNIGSNINQGISPPNIIFKTSLLFFLFIHSLIKNKTNTIGHKGANKLDTKDTHTAHQKLSKLSSKI